MASAWMFFGEPEVRVEGRGGRGADSDRAKGLWATAGSRGSGGRSPRSRSAREFAVSRVRRRVEWDGRTRDERAAKLTKHSSRNQTLPKSIGIREIDRKAVKCVREVATLIVGDRLVSLRGRSIRHRKRHAGNSRHFFSGAGTATSGAGGTSMGGTRSGAQRRPTTSIGGGGKSKSRTRARGLPLHSALPPPRTPKMPELSAREQDSHGLRAGRTWRRAGRPHAIERGGSFACTRAVGLLVEANRNIRPSLFDYELGAGPWRSSRTAAITWYRQSTGARRSGYADHRPAVMACPVDDLADGEATEIHLSLSGIGLAFMATSAAHR